MPSLDNAVLQAVSVHRLLECWQQLPVLLSEALCKSLGSARACHARHAGSSSLAGYADFDAAAAAAARNHPYSSGFRTAWAPGGAPPRFSNGVVGAVLVIPLVIT